MCYSDFLASFSRLGEIDVLQFICIYLPCEMFCLIFFRCTGDGPGLYIFALLNIFSNPLFIHFWLHSSSPVFASDTARLPCTGGPFGASLHLWAFPLFWAASTRRHPGRPALVSSHLTCMFHSSVCVGGCVCV